MPKWEYTLVLTLAGPALEKQLNERGLEGWEAVAAVHPGFGMVAEWILMKRPAS
jgi:hypothetical protein